MNKFEFNRLNDKSKERALRTALIRKVNGLVSREVLEMVISKLDLNRQYNIKVIHDFKSYAKVLKLKDFYIDEASKTESYYQKGEVLYGNVGFGLKKDHKIDSFNETRIKEKQEANFVLNLFSAVLLEDTKKIKNEKKSFEHSHYRIFLYIPKEAPKGVYQTFMRNKQIEILSDKIVEKTNSMISFEKAEDFVGKLDLSKFYKINVFFDEKEFQKKTILKDFFLEFPNSKKKFSQLGTNLLGKVDFGFEYKCSLFENETETQLDYEIENSIFENKIQVVLIKNESVLIENGEENKDFEYEILIYLPIIY